LNTKEDHLKNVGYQTVDSPHWLPWIFFSHLWKSMASVNCLIINILQNIILLCSKEKKKDTRTGLEQLEGEW